ncbi:sulfite exporter TauE/SafE family protein [Bacillus sp. Au-Bac7]|uniref:sulfite exporter TauE/SafE family protein n=1 Tax=Bacillus sp. Au-Bac7 TaxID=2906458 RepID=UPI001E57646D|nr:sulfite exporter TauE/SafE family protein [Bacillus sp. Au-Bac7]MCE4048934.1 sulfite exporter TauE/SafE family protein [Bacillus sp. Au-Bac7]
MDIYICILLVIVGIIAGGYGTIVGSGGGFIFVPALLLIFHMDPKLAAGSGLVIVLINSLSGVVGYAKQKRISYHTGLTLSAGAIPGSLLGVWLLQIYSSSYFYVIFATVLVALGIFLFTKNPPFASLKKKRRLLSKEGSGEDEVAAAVEKTPDFKETACLPLVSILPIGFFMGILSSYLGIGGGWLLVPILIYAFKLPTHIATATSIFSLTIYSLVGVFLQLFYSSIDWNTVLWGSIGVIIGSQIGVLLSRKIPGKVILQMLSVLLIIIGFRMYLS